MSQNQSHAAGGWQVSRHATPPEFPQFGIYSEGGEGIATVKGENAEADARLIAAAPRLLEALDELVKWAIEAEEEINRPLPVGYSARVKKPVVFEKARSAINDATTS